MKEAVSGTAAGTENIGLICAVFMRGAMLREVQGLPREVLSSGGSFYI